jgi:ABC-type nitrate/sulfonate/bicarbonate transport system ATPase subunit
MRNATVRKGPTPMPEPVDAIVEVRGISKTYGNVEALRGIDLDFPRGKLTSLLGPSGCGKTTLLKIIAGLIEADAGTVSVNGRTVSKPGPERAFVFQDFALLPWATVLRNVASGWNCAASRSPSGRKPRATISARSGFPASRTSTRTNFPVACASASASPARFP